MIPTATPYGAREYNAAFREGWSSRPEASGREDGRVQETGGAAGWPGLQDRRRVIATFSTGTPGQPPNPLFRPVPLDGSGERPDRQGPDARGDE